MRKDQARIMDLLYNIQDGSRLIILTHCVTGETLLRRIAKDGVERVRIQEQIFAIAKANGLEVVQ